MIWQKLKTKQLIAVLLVLSFVLPFAKFAKAQVSDWELPILDELAPMDTPQAPPSGIYPGAAPPSDTGGGIWSWLGSSAACLGGLGLEVGSMGTSSAATGGTSTTATIGACAGLGSKITKFLGGTVGGWFNKGLNMGLDAITKSVRKNLLSKLYKNMLDYIAGEGNQVWDWNLYREEDIANETRGLLLNQIAKATIDPDIDLCNPWDDFGPATNETTAFFKLILGEQAPEKQWSCKASEIKKAGKAFFENFEGGWDAWLEVTTKPMANPYGQYLWAIENKNALIDKLTKEKENQAIAGGGYLGQEKVMQWHIIAEASETNKGGVVFMDTCPLECNPGDTGDYCDCYPDGVSLKDLENYYGLRKDDNNRLTAGTTMPAICKTVHEQETKACYLVVDRKELVTPGGVFLNLASNILGKDIRAAETGDASVLEYYTTKLLDDTLNALIKRGVRGLGDLLKPDAEQEGDGFHITSRREQIGALEEEGAFEALKSTYEETLLALNDILDKKGELKSLLSTFTADKELQKESKEFYYCAMNKCVEQEYNYCLTLYHKISDPTKDFDKACVTTCQTGLTCGQKVVKSTDEKDYTLVEKCEEEKRKVEPDTNYCEQKSFCEKDCEREPSCALSTSDLGKCRSESYDYCANPRLPGPEYDNPQVQKTYEFYANLTSYATQEGRTEMINKADYGGFFDDCKQEGFESSKLETCFNQKLAGLIDIDQFIIWDKIIIQEFQELDDQQNKDKEIAELVKTTPGNTSTGCWENANQECKNIQEYYKSYLLYPQRGGDKARTTDFWQTMLKNDQSLKDKKYGNGLDAYKYLVAKRKLLRNVYNTKLKVPNTDLCQKGCDLEELADLLSGKKQARVLKMDTWNKNAYKTQWENKAKELEQERTKEKPDANIIAQLENELEKIKTASGNLNDDIKKLNDDITALQKVYDQTTKDLVAMLTEIDSIINATKIDKQLEEAKNFMGEGYVEVYDGKEGTKTKLWVEAEIDKMNKYNASLQCNQDQKDYRPTKPSSASASTPPAAH